MVDHVDDLRDGFGFGGRIVGWPGSIEGSLKRFRADFGISDVCGYSDVDGFRKHKTGSKSIVNLLLTFRT